MHSKKKEKTTENLVAKQICFAGVFKEIKPYVDPSTKHSLLKMKLEKEKTEFKFCMNWACGKKFLDNPEENTIKSCKCHPGKYDHGATGMKMVDYLMEIVMPPKDRKTILWEPHWTCCRKGWDSPGCRTMKHKGLFVEEVEQGKLRPYHWPDFRAKLYFGKVVSDRWKEHIKKYMYSEDQVRSILSKNSWSSSDIAKLCDQLRLYLVLINEKPDYHLKFNDVATKSGTVNYFYDNNDNVKKEEFIKWWFGSYEEIANECVKIGKFS